MARRSRPVKETLTRTVEDLDTPGMDSRWFSEDENEVDKVKTREMLANSTIQFRLLKRILQLEFNSKQIQPTDFDNPNFNEQRIYTEGYLRALQIIYKILP
jgi:hypothetical protein